MRTGVVLTAAALAGVAVNIAHLPPALGADALVQITLSANETTLKISASVLATGDTTVSGELVVDRKGASGVVSTRHERDLVLSAGSVETIADLSISFGKTDALDVVATVYKDGVVVSRATVRTSGL